MTDAKEIDEKISKIYLFILDKKKDADNILSEIQDLCKDIISLQLLKGKMNG